MMQLGTKHNMRVSHKQGENYILKDEEGGSAILFRRELTQAIDEENELEVFLYSDPEHPFIATLKEPKILLNEFAFLKVTAVNKMGAFLDWGLAKDLLVPFSNQKLKMELGKYYLVYLYFDEASQRLVGSGKISAFYSNEGHNLQPKDEVELLIADKSVLGYNVIIDKKYHGLLFNSEIIRPVRTGDEIKGYIKTIREDGKIDVRLRKPGHHEVNDAESFILDKLEKNNGQLDLSDKSSPDDIKLVLKMSKKTFKAAIGQLYKKKLIVIHDDGIELV